MQDTAMRDTDREEKKITDPVTPPGEWRYGVERADERDTKTVASASILGMVAAGALGGAVGLILSAIPALGLAWWGGLIIGATVGLVAGGMMLARLSFPRSAEQDAFGNIPRVRTPPPRGSIR